MTLIADAKQISKTLKTYAAPIKVPAELRAVENITFQDMVAPRAIPTIPTNITSGTLALTPLELLMADRRPRLVSTQRHISLAKPEPTTFGTASKDANAGAPLLYISDNHNDRTPAAVKQDRPTLVHSHNAK